MNEQTTAVREAQGDVEYTNAVLRQLLEYYLADMPQPSQEETPMTVARFHRLCRYVLAEGYGQ